jgi:cell division transport system permease protein
MVPLRLLAILLRDAVKDLLRHRGQNLLAMLTLTSGLLLAGGGLMLVEALDHWVGNLEGLARITVFAAEGGNLDEAEARLRRDPRIIALRRVSSAENAQAFREATREAGVLLDSAGAGALPASLELRLRQDLIQGRKAMQVADDLKAFPGVGDVLVDQERLEGLQRFGRLARSALSSLGLLLLLAAGFATGNVIRMSILAREEEISIMRLVGATERFILAPLVAQGALLGLIGSMAALVTLWGLWFPASKGLLGLSPLLVSLARQGFFSVGGMALLALLGALTGALGAGWGFWSTQRAQRLLEAQAEGL